MRLRGNLTQALSLSVIWDSKYGTLVLSSTLNSGSLSVQASTEKNSIPNLQFTPWRATSKTSPT